MDYNLHFNSTNRVEVMPLLPTRPRIQVPHVTRTVLTTELMPVTSWTPGPALPPHQVLSPTRDRILDEIEDKNTRCSSRRTVHSQSWGRSYT